MTATGTVFVLYRSKLLHCTHGTGWKAGSVCLGTPGPSPPPPFARLDWAGRTLRKKQIGRFAWPALRKLHLPPDAIRYALVGEVARHVEWQSGISRRGIRALICQPLWAQLAQIYLRS
ncbi:hypothetical protein XELAEV_18027020mg [Xenopus laevis]|uniref:Uncharacterized protein n=1 Tax=Xenopus laevis TaxID=8355 RepID=A0A974HJD9_XENLA|nr:hypothetical protein XELAEV_18027020mg [Xenopus laevis]